MNQQDAFLDWTVMDEPPLPGAIGPVLKVNGYAVGVPLLARGVRPPPASGDDANSG